MIITPEVSVIIPTHNRKELLTRAIRSVLDQTYQDFEIIVVDDFGASEDCGKLDPRIRYIRSDTTGYPGASRNKGIDISKGTYIAFLDDDDIWTPDKLKKQISLMKKDESLGMVCGNMYQVSSPDEKPIHKYFADKPQMAGNLLVKMILQSFAHTPTCLLRREVFSTVGTFFVDPRMKVAEDTDMWMRVATAYNIVYDPEPLVIRLLDLKEGDNISRKYSTPTRNDVYQFKAVQLAYRRLLHYRIPLLARLLVYLQIVNYQFKIIHDKFKGKWPDQT
jgi:glycosyltransferase involved in cell wall biosynthesis